MASTTSGRSKATAADPSLETQTQGSEPLQEAAGEIADQAGRTADAKASTMMTQAGDALEQVARAARDAANSLRQERPEVAGFVETGATKAEEAAQYLRQHNAREAIATAEEAARKQPALVIAGGLALGLVAARFLRSAGGSGSMSGSGSGMYGTSGMSGMSGSQGTSDWYDVGAGSSVGSAQNVGTRPYAMGETTGGGSESGIGNGAGTESAYRLSESGE
jgi:hypothetical protein